MTEHEAYTVAMNELASEKRDEATWLKAYAHSEGNDQSTRAKYVLFRAEALRAESRQRSSGAVISKIITGALFLTGLAPGVGLVIFGFYYFYAATKFQQSKAESQFGHAGALLAIVVGILIVKTLISWVKKPTGMKSPRNPT